VPILVGSISTYVLSHAWQDYRYKIQIKEKLLDAFHAYVHVGFNVQQTIAREISDYYSEHQVLEKLLETGLIGHIFTIPNDPSRLPLVVFSDLSKQFPKILNDAFYARSLLSSKLSLYSNVDQLQKDLGDLSNHFGYSLALIKKLLHTKNTEELRTVHPQLHTKILENEKLVKSFEKNLAELKIRKIPV
jgi:hypothetical protein